MKAVILAGGFGTRISEESAVRPKPMVEIGGKPILWHIMKTYATYGLTDFVICLGYKSHVIKEYFINYAVNSADLEVNLKNHQIKYLRNGSEPWNVKLIETGDESMTGGRIKRIQPYVGNEPFCVTYGDGVSDVNISKLIDFHASHGKVATVIAVQPPGRFGILQIDTPTDEVISFKEKPNDEIGWINGGFMVLSPEVFDYIQDDTTVFEQEPMRQLAHDRQLVAYRHEGFWQCLDTLRDKKVLEEIWQSGHAPWKIW